MAFTRREVVIGASVVGIGAAVPAWALPDAGDAAAVAVLDGLAEDMLVQFPEHALAIGLDKGERSRLRSRFADRSAGADHARAAWCRSSLAALQQIDRKPLSIGVATNVDVAEQAFQLADEGWRTMPVGDMALLNPAISFRNSPYVVTQLGGAYSDLPDVLENKHDVVGAMDADAYLSRLEGYAAALDGETERIHAGAARGSVPPVVVLDLTASQINGIRRTPVEQWAVATSFIDKCTKAGLPETYGKRAVRICRDSVLPALGRQSAALSALRAKASEVPGVWQRPNGDAYYRWLVKAGTTTTATPAEIHALGLAQSRAIQNELDVLLKAQGLSQGTVGQRLTALGKRPNLLFSNDAAGRAQLLAYLNGRIAAIRPRLSNAFGKPVKGNLVIKRVPEAIQDGAPSGYAGPGSIDGTQPGLYYVNLKSTANWPRYSLPTLCYHEGIPGHIWQGEYSYRLPLIRLLLSFNAYSEGWALYAEQLADELGMYDDDPLGRIGYLQAANFRACRLVTDTGLHAKRWGFAQSIDWLQSATGLPIGQATAEIKRYCAMPGQACGYKMGHNEINRLRTRSKAVLGSKYDLKAFDDTIVDAGNMPLTLLEQVVDRYVKAASA